MVGQNVSPKRLVRPMREIFASRVRTPNIMEPSQGQTGQPSLWRWIVKFSAMIGLSGMVCCVAPMVLFMMGLMGGVYAISFANGFYTEDGSAGIGAWVLRIVAALIGITGVVLYKRKQDQCSIDSRRKRKNLVLLTVLIATFGVGFFFTLERLTSWYFNEYVVPAQQAELAERETASLD